MVGAPGRVGTWRPARQATPHLVYTFVYDSEFLMSTRLDSDDDDDPHLPLNPHLITTVGRRGRRSPGAARWGGERYRDERRR
jgi:hypothetical protein